MICLNQNIFFYRIFLCGHVPWTLLGACSYGDIFMTLWWGNISSIFSSNVKHPLPNYLNILKKFSPVTAWTVMLSANSDCQPHIGVLAVAKGLKRVWIFTFVILFLKLCGCWPPVQLLPWTQSVLSILLLGLWRECVFSLLRVGEVQESQEGRTRH